MGNKISKAQLAEIEQDLSNAIKDFGETWEEFKKARACIVMDNCPRCNGTGEVKFSGDPAHNPTRDTLYRPCPDCDGKGYVE